MIYYLNKRLPFFISALIWLGIVLLFFYPFTLEGKIIAPIDCLECVFRPFAYKPIEEVHNQYLCDAVTQYLPYKWAIKESFVQDGYMGWNPYLFNGTAIPANTMLSPGDWHNLLFAVLPYWNAWNWSIILQFFLAGCGMIVLLRGFRIPMAAVLLAAVSYAFYSQFIMWLYDKWLGTMVWAPFVVWSLLKFKRNFVNVPAIIFLALAWRGGHMQSCVFAFILVGLLWAAEVWKEEGKWPSWRRFSWITLSYFVTGVLSLLLSLDVFVNTLPEMVGCRDLKFKWGIQNLASIVTSIFPTVYGEPRTMDVGKLFMSSLYDVKYGGGIVFVISLVACYSSRAPRAAKFLFLGSVLLVCTPLDTYIYSRSTVIMALGMAWLAAWQLHDYTIHEKSLACWKRIACALIISMGVWTVLSVLITCNRVDILGFLDGVIAAKSQTAQQDGRQLWYDLRCERFLSHICIWDWKNLVLCTGLLLGVFCVYHLRPGNKGNLWCLLGLVFITFVDVATYSSVWLTYAEKPSGPYLYMAPSWVPELQKQVKDGSVSICNPAKDYDFLCANHLSTYGIRLSEGYETVKQSCISPISPLEYDAADYALAGISHIMCDKKWEMPSFSGWNLVMDEKDFNLYENPLYKGRYLSEESVPITENWRTYNRISLRVPPEAKTLTILETYHKGWKAYVGEQEITITPTERGGMHLQLPDSEQPYDLLLQFCMPYRMIYYPVMCVCALALFVVAIVQRRRSGLLAFNGWNH